MKKSMILLMIVLSLILAPQTFAAPNQPVTINHQYDGMIPTENIIYVNDDADGDEDGSSWANAYTTLQDALAAAESGDQIWVAKGVYYPDEYLTSDAPALDDPRDATFQLESGVAIYGGFAGIESETGLDDRAWESNVTVLSGDIDYDNDDESDGKDNNKDPNGVISSPDDIQGDNAYHVVTGSGTDNSAILNGFTINAGNAIGDDLVIPNGGGGVYNDMGSPFLENLTIRANSATDGIVRDGREDKVVAAHGGGIFNDNSSNPTLKDVTITYNSATGNGGGISNDNSSSPALEHVTITGNSATGNGGGISNDNSSSPTLKDVTITHNQGGGIVNNSSSSPTLKDVTITHNQGGGIGNGNLSSPMLEDVTITHNQGVGIGNGSSSSPMLENVTITHNQGGGIFNLESSPTLKNVTITNNSTTGDGGGILNWESQPTLEDVTITHNSATDGRGGGMSNFFSAPTLIRTKITSNRAKHGGGLFNSAHHTLEICFAIYRDGCLLISSSRATLEEVTITDNFASEHGGGIYNEYMSRVYMKNGTIANNEADLGGGIYNYSESRGTFENVTVTDNSATNGGGMYNNNSFWDTFKDVVIKNNSVSENGGGIYNNDLRSLTLTGMTIKDNSADNDGGGIYNANSNSTLTLAEMTIENNSASENGGGVYNFLSSPTLTEMTIENNSATKDGGGIYNANSSPTLTEMTIKGNSASENGGGIYNATSHPTLDWMIIENNSATKDGGGVYNDSSSSPTLTNALIDNNRAGQHGGGISNSDSQPTLINVTLNANAADGLGGGIYNASSSETTVTNVIMWNNTADGAQGPMSDSIHHVDGTLRIKNSLIEGYGASGQNWQGPEGSDLHGNIDEDPLFKTDDDLSLQFNSPAVDAGDSSANNEPTDLAGHTRIQGGAIDMGAYEAEPVPDIEVQGQEIEISSGDNEPSANDDTDFGNVVILSDITPKTFMIHNKGHMDLTLNELSPVSLSTSGTFTVTEQPQTSLAHGQSSAFVIQFAPSTTGVHTATVRIENNDPDENPYTFTIQGQGLGPDIEVQGKGIEISSGDSEPSANDDTDFGEAVILSDTIRHTFTIHNSGNMDLTLNQSSPVSLSTSGTFTVTQQPDSTIAPNQSSTFIIDFGPSITGTEQAMVTIENNDPDEDPYTFKIQGTGVAPEIQLQGKGIEIASGDMQPSSSNDSDFGEAVMLSDTIRHTFTIHNQGDANLTLNGSSPVSLSTSGTFTVSQQPNTTIAPNQSSEFTIDFGPSITGTYQAIVRIENNDPDENPYTFKIQGTGIAPEIQLQGKGIEISSGDMQPSASDDTEFGHFVISNNPISHTFTIHNQGNMDLTLDGSSPVSLSTSGIFTVSQQPATTISPNQSSEFIIDFAPSTTGDHTATVTIENDDPNEDPYTFLIQGTGLASEIELQGKGVEISSGDMLPSSSDDTKFADAVILSDTISHTFTIHNQGNMDLTLDGSSPVSLSTNGIFTVRQQPATTTIAPNQSSTFMIQFGPNTTGVHTATVSIENNDLDEDPYTFMIQGAGVLPEMEVQGQGIEILNGDRDPSSRDDTDFGEAVMLSDTIRHTFTISNAGTSTLTLSEPITLSNNIDFTISRSPSASTIAAGKALTFDVSFSPSSTGTLTSTLEIGNDDTDENPYHFVIAGTGVLPEIQLQGNGVEISSGDMQPSITDHTDFANAFILSDTIRHTFTIHNQGDANLTLNGSSPVSLSTSGTFTVSQQPNTTIAPNQSSEFTIDFAPSLTGTHQATVIIENSDPNEDPYTFKIQGKGMAPEIQLQGKGIEISSGDMQPSSSDDTDFGEAVILSDTISRTFTIHNQGDANLTLNQSSPVSLSTSGIFTVSQQPATTTIAANQSSEFIIDFAPSLTGTHQATVRIENNDANEDPYTFLIQGTALAPEIDVHGKGILISNGDTEASTNDETDFGDAVILSDTLRHTFTIHNQGNADLILNGSSPVSLSTSGIFTVSQQPTTTIPSGQSSTFVIDFAPSTTEPYQAIVSIKSNDSDENPYTFMIQGMGADTDGIESRIEEQVPGLNGSNTGDGNGDGVPDYQQEHVASLPASTNDYVTLATEEGKRLINVRPENEPAGAPTQTQFPYGHFSFEVTGLSQGEAISVTLTIHDDQSTPTTFWKYGPTPDNQSDHWYEFNYDEQSKTGAIINGQSITLYFVDGQRGDNDLVANGQIMDPGAPAMPATDGPSPSATPSPSSTPLPNPTPTPTPPSTNQPPVLHQPLPHIVVVEGTEAQSFNPFDYFSDPEGDLIFFYVTGNSNPAVVPNLPMGLELGNIDQLPIQFGVPGQSEITIVAKEMWSHATTKNTFTVTVLERPKISISKSVSDQSVEAGQRITYTIAITNSGPSTVTNALISDLLPTDITFAPSSISASGIKTGTIGSTPPILASGVTITPSQKIELSFAATVNQNALANQAITSTVQLTSTEVITPAQALNLITVVPPSPADADADGVNNDIEDQVPNPNGNGSGDGNEDGIPDSQQHHVASLPNRTTGDYVTFVAPNNQSLKDVDSISVPADAPPEATFSQGVFTFGITALSAGQASSIRLILHSSDSNNLPNSYWKYGPTPGNPTDHWYNFLFDGTTGAQIEGNTITLHFVDGQRGDADLSANGQLSDPGGPALYQPPTALTLTQMQAQSSGNWQLLLLGGLVLMMLLSAGIRHHTYR